MGFRTENVARSIKANRSAAVLSNRHFAQRRDMARVVVLPVLQWRAKSSPS